MGQIIIFDYFSAAKSCLYTEFVINALEYAGGRKKVTLHAVFEDGLVYTLKSGAGWIKPRNVQMTQGDIAQKYDMCIFFNRQLGEMDFSKEVQKLRLQREQCAQGMLIAEHLNDIKMFMINEKNYKIVSRDVVQSLWNNALKYDAPNQDEMNVLLMAGVYQIITRDFLGDFEGFFERLSTEMGEENSERLMKAFTSDEFISAQEIFEQIKREKPVVKELLNKSLI